MSLKKNEGNIQNRNCSGCMACLYICPVGCIRIKTDATGNFVRVIEDKKCIGCAHCESVCPMNRIEGGSIPKKAYVAWSKRVERKSSSGGIAAALYRWGISKQIMCVGVKWNENFAAKYDFVNKNEIESFSGSKYVWSRMGNIYGLVLKKLEVGRRVIFIGLPCHVAALRNVVAERDKDLICIDLVCHGVSAERFLQEHLARLRKRVKTTCFKRIEFREKENPFGLTVIGDKGKIIKRQPKWSDEYMSGYCEGFTYCEQCYKCPYASKERYSDLTIKDFSGNLPEKIRRKVNGGTSNILVNTDKGAALLEELGSSLELFDYPVEAVIAEDAMLRLPTPRGKRGLFVKLYPVLGFDHSVWVLCFSSRIKGEIKRIFEKS